MKTAFKALIVFLLVPYLQRCILFNIRAMAKLSEKLDMLAYLAAKGAAR